MQRNSLIEKKTLYNVYVHFCQNTEEVYMASIRVSGHCKHCAALLYHLCGYMQLDLKRVPDDKSCADTLQQCYVPSESRNTGTYFS